MGHYAQIDANNIVIQVIVAKSDFIQSGSVGDPDKWIKTSYNTYGGEYNGAGSIDDDISRRRKNYAGIGYYYDKELDAFIPPQLYPSWILNTTTCLWDPPIPMPEEEGMWSWIEETQSWQRSNV